ncbi:hypothetical protein NCS56_01443000 [Fusarium sp. Ph1]|nr:hypothetical protein NCS56_01443000 [Fusarium sp. Ph1]
MDARTFALSYDGMPEIEILKEYDYVVVGGGASGLTGANRLSEDRDVTGLILEVGDVDANEDFLTIPALAGGAVGMKKFGGSTKLNQMTFNRGSSSDYDRWVELGNEGWGWEALFPYLNKNEIFTPPNKNIAQEYDINFDPSVHGTSGYVHSSYSPFFWPTTIKAPLQRSNLTDATFAARDREQYEEYREGPLTSPLGDFLVFMPLSNFSNASSDIYQEAMNQDGTEYLPADTPNQVIEGYKRQHKILNNRLLGSESTIFEVIRDDGKMLLCLQHPYSRGSIKAISPSTFYAPVADPALIKNSLDVTILTEGIRFGRRLVDAPAMQSSSPLKLSLEPVSQAFDCI